jgi:hypothetical protein
MKRVLVGVLVVWVMAAAPGWSQELQSLRIVDWNIEALFDPSAAETRAADFQQFAAELKPDILLLEEVTKLSTVEKVRELMGLPPVSTCDRV